MGVTRLNVDGFADMLSKMNVGDYIEFCTGYNINTYGHLMTKYNHFAKKIRVEEVGYEFILLDSIYGGQKATVDISPYISNCKDAFLPYAKSYFKFMQTEDMDKINYVYVITED